ncbi:hypothetical protein ACETU7_07120 [Rhodococcus sp. 3Y1]
MQLAQKVAGYTLGQADLLRRAMGKKKLSELERPTPASGRACWTTTSAKPPSRRCGTRSFPSPATRSTSRTPPATDSCRTGLRTSRRTTRPSTWRVC